MMRRWLPYAGIAAFYIAVAVVIRLVLAPLFLERVGPDAKSAQLYALQARVAYENQKLRSIMLRDTVETLIPTSPAAFVAAPTSVAGYVRHVLDRELQVTPRAAIGAVAIPLVYGSHPDVTHHFWQRSYVVGSKAGVPYCAAVLPSESEKILASHIAEQGLLGTCRWWARYGQPGVHMERWLQQGAWRFGARREHAPELEMLGAYRPPPFAFGARKRWALPLPGQACIAGRREMCAEAVLTPDTLQPAGETPYLPIRGPRLVTGEAEMFAALEREFGKDRFQRFWSSDRPAEAAFEDAFGLRLGSWVYAWLEPAGYMQAGARLDGVSVLLTMLLLGVLVGAVILIAQRRRI